MIFLSNYSKTVFEESKTKLQEDFDQKEQQMNEKLQKMTEDHKEALTKANDELESKEKQYKSTLSKEQDDFRKNKKALKNELVNIVKEKDKLEEENKNLEEKLEDIQKDIFTLLDIKERNLVLDLSNSSDLSKLEKLSNIKLPPMRKIKLDKVPSNNSTVKSLVKNSISNKVELFNFNTKGDTISESDYVD
jgi:exonuclease VII large subunit